MSVGGAGKIVPGMRIMMVDHIPVDELTLHQVVAFIQSVGRPLICSFLIEDSTRVMDDGKSRGQAVVDAMHLEVRWLLCAWNGNVYLCSDFSTTRAAKSRASA